MMQSEFCCTPLTDGIVATPEAEDIAATFAALGDPVRVRIVSMLAAAPDGAACGCDLEAPLGLSQPTVSHHLKILREAGLVEGTKQGRWVFYRVNPNRLEEMRDLLRQRVIV
jgi:ArsR family transcriptional regulator, arsenate/arsenite/antimonite-responsive transcriptional repressor